MLGLYRSIIENENLDIDDKIKLRDYAHKIFNKTFDFLQLKDPKVFVEVSTLGQELTEGDIQKYGMTFLKIKKNISDKKIKHRNFGTYSKHNYGNDDCIYNGLMIRQNSWLTETNMHFSFDTNKYQQKLNSDRRKADRKNEKQIINRELNND